MSLIFKGSQMLTEYYIPMLRNQTLLLVKIVQVTRV